MSGQNITKKCWFLSVLVTCFLVASPAAFATGKIAIDDGEADAALNTMPASQASEAQVTGVGCSVRHDGYGVTIGSMFFSINAIHESATIVGPTANLFKIEFESVAGDIPSALLTLRGDTNYIRFLDSKANFVSLRNGLDGFGTKSIQGLNTSVTFQLITSTGKPGLIVVDCRLETSVRLPAQARVAASGGATEINFSDSAE